MIASPVSDTKTEIDQYDDNEAALLSSSSSRDDDVVANKSNNIIMIPKRFPKENKECHDVDIRHGHVDDDNEKERSSVDNNMMMSIPDDSMETNHNKNHHHHPTAPFGIVTPIHSPESSSADTAQKKAPQMKEDNIQKAISFLQNPTIRDVSNEEKRMYLKTYTKDNNLSTEEIDAAMNRIVVAAAAADEKEEEEEEESRGMGPKRGSNNSSENHDNHWATKQDDYERKKDDLVDDHKDSNGREEVSNNYDSRQYHRQAHPQQHRSHRSRDYGQEEDYHHLYDNKHNNYHPNRNRSTPGRPQMMSPMQYHYLPNDDNNIDWPTRREYDHHSHHYDPQYNPNHYYYYRDGDFYHSYNNNNDRSRYHHHPNHHPMATIEGAIEEEDADTAQGGGGGITSWMGGFSLGIVGLAIWRWLNGGDFVLLPPPSLLHTNNNNNNNNSNNNNMMPSTSSISNLMVNEKKNKSEHEGSISNSSYQREERTDEEEEEEEEEEDDDEYNVEDEVVYDIVEDEFESQDLRTIRHPSSTNNNNRILPPLSQQQQPLTPSSYNELVLELRALTSAIHTHRDSQERIARNAYNSDVGKGMTDDAMEFLRKQKQKKKKVEEEEEEEDRTKITLDKKKNRHVLENQPKNNGVDMVVSSLLHDISDDLFQLKKNVSMCGTTQEMSVDRACNEDDCVKMDLDAVEGDNGSPTKNGMKELTVQLDRVIDKVQKILTVVHETLNQRERVCPRPLEEHSEALIEMEGRNKTCGTTNVSALVPEEATLLDGNILVPQESIISDEVERQNETSMTHTIISCDPSQTYIAHQQQLLGGENEAHNPQNKQLEDALRTLANNNDASKLKVGAQMLYLYCRNISQNASVPRYRKIYTNNDTFRSKVGNLVGAKDFLIAVGFVENAKENVFEWMERDACSNGGAAVLNCDTKSKLDFALVALELIKNNSYKNK